MIARYASSLVCLVILGSWWLDPREALAQTAESTIALSYTAAPGCPGRAELEGMVIARLGYDPFSEAAPKHVSLRISAHGAALDGRTEWRDASGKWAGDQSFRMAAGDCPRLTRTMALALAVQLQLLSDARADESRSTPAAEPPPKASSAEPAPARPRSPDPAGTPSAPASAVNPLRASSPSRAPRFALGGGGSVAFGRSSTPILLGRAFGTLAWQRIAFELGAELSVPSTTRRADGAGFSQRARLVGAAGCWVLARYRACLLFNAGEVRMVGEDIDLPSTGRVLLLEAGARIGFSQPLGPRFFLGAHLDGLASLARRTARLDAVPVWTSPPLVAALGLDAGLRFP